MFSELRTSDCVVLARLSLHTSMAEFTYPRCIHLNREKLNVPVFSHKQGSRIGQWPSVERFSQEINQSNGVSGFTNLQIGLIP